MAWIESHQELARHPKTRKLARALGASRAAVIGHLHLLWWWCLDFAQDGDLGGYEDEEIAEAAAWDGAPDQLIDGLSEAGFLTADRRVHDWDEYTGKLIERRAANAERMRQARARDRAQHVQDDSPERAQHVPDTVPARVGLPYRTVQNTTGEDVPPLTPPSGGLPPPAAADGAVGATGGHGPPGPAPPAPVPPLPRAAPKPSRDPPPDLAAAFDRFWQAWPKRVGRAEALAAFAKLRPTDDDVGRIVAAIAVQSEALGWPRDRYRYCPHPATWLTNRRWEDEPPEDRQGSAHGRPYASTDLDASMALMRSRRDDVYDAPPRAKGLEAGAG